MSNIRYNNEDYPLSPVPIRLLYISVSKFEGDWHSHLHSHQCTELFYVLSGKGEFQVDELRFPVVPGDMVTINPNVQHTETGIKNSPMEYIVLGVEGAEFLLDDNDESRFCTFACGAAGVEILRILRKILAELKEKRQHPGIIARNLLENPCVKLLRHRLVSLERQPTSKRASLE